MWTGKAFEILTVNMLFEGYINICEFRDYFVGLDLLK